MLGGGAVGLDHDPLDEHPEHEEEGTGDQDREVRIDPEEHEQPVGGVHPQHHHRPVGEVDDAEHPEDQGEAARDQPVDAAQQQTADDGLEEEPGHLGQVTSARSPGKIG